MILNFDQNLRRIFNLKMSFKNHRVNSMAGREDFDYLKGVDENYQTVAKSQRNQNGNKNILISQKIQNDAKDLQ